MIVFIGIVYKTRFQKDKNREEKNNFFSVPNIIINFQEKLRNIVCRAFALLQTYLNYYTFIISLTITSEGQHRFFVK